MMGNLKPLFIFVFLIKQSVGFKLGSLGLGQRPTREYAQHLTTSMDQVLKSRPATGNDLTFESRRFFPWQKKKKEGERNRRSRCMNESLQSQSVSQSFEVIRVKRGATNQNELKFCCLCDEGSGNNVNNSNNNINISNSNNKEWKKDTFNWKCELPILNGELDRLLE